MTDFKGKVVWITGASSGLGESLAYKFSAAGAKLILSARNRDLLYEVKERCVGNQSNIHVLPIDLNELETLEHLSSEGEKIFGRVDVLIHSGGISQRSLVMETDLEVTERIMRVNFTGGVILTKKVLRGMINRNEGNIVVISSLTGKFGTPLRSSYAASKHALHGFYDSLRAELVDKKIKITILCPGFIKTNVSLNALTGDGRAQQKMDDSQANGMLPSVFAEKAMKAISKGKEEVGIGGKELIAIYFKRFFPKRFSKFISKAKVT
ncbi:MAG: dehydrogenase/reductase SDR family protein 7B [Sphingobacteriales bacterium]|jgi:dehydrogenase/reductase SDR family protein 7B